MTVLFWIGRSDRVLEPRFDLLPVLRECVVLAKRGRKEERRRKKEEERKEGGGSAIQRTKLSSTSSKFSGQSQRMKKKLSLGHESDMNQKGKKIAQPEARGQKKN